MAPTAAAFWGTKCNFVVDSKEVKTTRLKPRNDLESLSLAGFSSSRCNLRFYVLQLLKALGWGGGGGDLDSMGDAKKRNAGRLTMVQKAMTVASRVVR